MCPRQEEIGAETAAPAAGRQIEGKIDVLLGLETSEDLGGQRERSKKRVSSSAKAVRAVRSGSPCKAQDRGYR